MDEVDEEVNEEAGEEAERDGVGLLAGLTLIEEGTGWNVYLDEGNEYVYLQHGTGLRLVEFDEIDLAAAWSDFEGGGFDRYSTFLDWLRTQTYEPDAVDGVAWCEDCWRIGLGEDMCSVGANGDRRVCEGCDEDYRSCNRCDGRFQHTTTTLSEEEICARCRDSYYSYCEECDGYYNTVDAGNHRHREGCDHNRGSDCVSPQLEFAVRNDGAEPLANDRGVTITLAAGTITNEGIAEIADHLRSVARSQQAPFGVPCSPEQDDAFSRWWTLAGDLEPLGAQWQTKGGNYTKRLSRHAHKAHGLKIPPDVLSAVGNIASAHSQAVDVKISVTRDLNMDPAEFAHEDSCWWQSYYHGRCALKTNGGFGLRTFDDYDVTGRAWVLPLRQVAPYQSMRSVPRCGRPGCDGCPTEVRTGGGDLSPTFDTLTPDAFVVFNGYGTLFDYAPARVLAHMAGWTYRKIAFTCSPMYVNAEAGYLVAPEALAQSYTDGSLHMTVDQHSTLFEDEQAAQSCNHPATDTNTDTDSREYVHA
jgi:hypothetical protein